MIPDQYIWLTFAILFLVPWGILYARFPQHRKVMLRSSLLTLPVSLSGPLFIPEYWSPPSLFDLARTTGFDVESPIFCFGIGGVAAVLYNILNRQVVEPIPAEVRQRAPRRLHTAALALPTVVFVPLAFLDWNIMYSGIIALAAGSVATALCRRDLFGQMWAGGVIFLLYYLVFLVGLRIVGDDYIERVWNLEALSGISLFSFPIEELLWAVAFGTYWSGLYEHFTWTRSVPDGDNHLFKNS